MGSAWSWFSGLARDVLDGIGHAAATVSAGVGAVANDPLVRAAYLANRLNEIDAQYNGVPPLELLGQYLSWRKELDGLVAAYAQLCAAGDAQDWQVGLHRMFQAAASQESARQRALLGALVSTIGPEWQELSESTAEKLVRQHNGIEVHLLQMGYTTAIAIPLFAVNDDNSVSLPSTTAVVRYYALYERVWTWGGAPKYQCVGVQPRYGRESVRELVQRVVLDPAVRRCVQVEMARAEIVAAFIPGGQAWFAMRALDPNETLEARTQAALELGILGAAKWAKSLRGTPVRAVFAKTAGDVKTRMPSPLGFGANGLYRAPIGIADEGVRAAYLAEANSLAFSVKLAIHNIFTLGRRWVTPAMIRQRLASAEFGRGSFSLVQREVEGQLLFGGAAKRTLLNAQFFHHELIHASQVIKNPYLWSTIPARLLHEPIQLLTAHGAIGWPILGGGIWYLYKWWHE